MKATLTEIIQYQFSFEEKETAKRFASNHEMDGFKIESQFIPEKKEDQGGSITLKKVTVFEK